MWDDMLRHMSDETIKKYNFEDLNLEVMVWTYVDGKNFVEIYFFS